MLTKNEKKVIRQMFNGLRHVSKHGVPITPAYILDIYLNSLWMATPQKITLKQYYRYENILNRFIDPLKYGKIVLKD